VGISLCGTSPSATTFQLCCFIPASKDKRKMTSVWHERLTNEGSKGASPPPAWGSCCELTCSQSPFPLGTSFPPSHLPSAGGSPISDDSRESSLEAVWTGGCSAPRVMRIARLSLPGQGLLGGREAGVCKRRDGHISSRLWVS
jgi:hypothetical protein